MPTDVFIQRMVAKPARQLGQELILDVKANGKNGIDDTQHISMLLAGAKIMYTLSKAGVYAPPDFEQDTAFRSAKPPRATMWLEHVYGYAGLSNLSSNLFYTHRGEVKPPSLPTLPLSHPGSSLIAGREGNSDG